MYYNKDGDFMKIERYTKLKNGQYKLSLDNNTNILLHEDLILKHELLIYKEIEEEDIDKLLEENTSYNAYDLALGYLKIKMRSKKEIKEYLLKKAVKEELINNAIEKLEEQGYLNDSIYAKAFINDKINLSNDGPYKIKENLMKLGISEDTVLENLEVFDREIEISKIQKLIDKQIKINHNKSNYLLKKKVMDYLVNLGYTKELVILLVNKVNIDDDDIMKKEYDKIYKKLSKKYSGKELEYKAKQKMYQKGFISTNIDF